MLATGTSRADAGRDLAELFGSQRGRLMLAVIVVVAAFYPKFGFARRTVAADFTGDRELILSTFRANGFSLVREQDGTMVFRASSPLKRALLLWEDRIAVTDAGGSVVLDGIRKEVVKAEFRSGRTSKTDRFSEMRKDLVVNNMIRIPALGIKK